VPQPAEEFDQREAEEDDARDDKSDGCHRNLDWYRINGGWIDGPPKSEGQADKPEESEAPDGNSQPAIGLALRVVGHGPRLRLGPAAPAHRHEHNADERALESRGPSWTARRVVACSWVAPRPRECDQSEDRHAEPSAKHEADSHADQPSPQLPSEKGAEDRASVDAKTDGEVAPQPDRNVLACASLRPALVAPHPVGPANWGAHERADLERHEHAATALVSRSLDHA
jgi:hypothetical protein